MKCAVCAALHCLDMNGDHIGNQCCFSLFSRKEYPVNCKLTILTAILQTRLNRCSLLMHPKLQTKNCKNGT